MNNNYNTDNKLREMENQLVPDLTQLETHWQHMKSTLRNHSLSKSPGRGFLNNPFRLFTLLTIAGLTYLFIYEFTPSAPIQSNSNNSSPSFNPKNTNQTDTVPTARKKVAVTERKDSSIHLVPQKKMAMQKKTYAIKNGNDSVGSVSFHTTDSQPDDAIQIYSAKKKVATHVTKKTPTTKDTLQLRPAKKKYPATDTLPLNLDSVNINTNVNHNKKVIKPINKNNNISIDSTRNW